MPHAAPVPKLTYDAYLALERSTDVRHEFLDGDVWAMAGGTPAHSLVKTNVTGALRELLKSKPCVTYDSDLKVRVEATGLSAYPDASVICGPLEVSAFDENAATNPTLLVEVLSPSTADFDRGSKFAHYRRIPTVREVLFISPEEGTIEHHWRNDDGTWGLRDLARDEAIALRSLDVTIAAGEVFARAAHATAGTSA